MFGFKVSVTIQFIVWEFNYCIFSYLPSFYYWTMLDKPMWQTLMYWTQNSTEKYYKGGWKRPFGFEIKLLRANL